MSRAMALAMTSSRAAGTSGTRVARRGTWAVSTLRIVSISLRAANGWLPLMAAPVLGVLELPGDAAAFLDNAVRAANEDFAGTLGVNLIADPRTIAALGPALDNAIAALRYGTVAVNAWTAVGFLTPRATWGAFEGHTVAEVGSGIGYVLTTDIDLS